MMRNLAIRRGLASKIRECSRWVTLWPAAMRDSDRCPLFRRRCDPEGSSNRSTFRAAAAPMFTKGRLCSLRDPVRASESAGFCALRARTALLCLFHGCRRWARAENRPDFSGFGGRKNRRGVRRGREAPYGAGNRRRRPVHRAPVQLPFHTPRRAARTRHFSRVSIGNACFTAAEIRMEPLFDPLFAV